MTIPPRYVPKFSHKDWIDNEDRVQAGGEEGINIRFHKLESEFRTLADEHINPLIRFVTPLATPEEAFLSLVPVLIPTRTDSGQTQAAQPWLISTDVAHKAAGQEQAHGLMNVILPEGAEITSLKVFGTKSGEGTLTVSLRHKDLTGSGAQDLVKVTALNTPTSLDPPARVSNATHRYFLVADLTGAPSDADSVKLSCFQIAYR
ncbi:hypothetical protein [Streptomyces sp. A012304]|uniref:hypothetical protein n=1 Tax=Streptomyces sp. A012304 TaxID=375446 RepID=UPI002231B0C9|nr:hypothetical protein [Streptomyces sp. A012304]GKQ37938.1 hypothetical protein ALMP_44730 [Streptomyces sp. A012304]